MAHDGWGYGPASYGHGYSAWELIGTRRVDFRAERDTVFAAGYQRYGQIKVCAYRQPVRLYDLDVYFHNGGHQDVPVRAVLNPGQCTRAIDLYGHRRNIQAVSFIYRSLASHPFGGPFLRPALIQVFAR
jgi:hypothetical protein